MILQVFGSIYHHGENEEWWKVGRALVPTPLPKQQQPRARLYRGHLSAMCVLYEFSPFCILQLAGFERTKSRKFLDRDMPTP